MAQNYSRKKSSNKGKGKVKHNKHGSTAEEDAMVAAFFADSPKKQNKEGEEEKV